MVVSQTAPKLTYQDYLSTSDDERYELLDGQLVMVPAPNMDHQDIVTNLGTALSVFVKEQELGRLYFAPTDVVLSDTDVVQPDLIFVSKEREQVRTPANIQGAPDLIVEILSPSSATRDWRDKRELYARHGVREYWVVDPSNKIVSIMLLQDGVLEIKGAYVAGDTVASSTLEGFSVALDDIF
jgi:Uma2 family endonuclease